MAAPSTISILRGVPSTVTWNGTTLGSTADQIFEPNAKYYEVWDQTRGSWDESYYLGEEPIFKAVLRYYDSDAIARMANPSGATFSFRPGGTTSNKRAGTTFTAGELKVVPRASAHPTLILYNAIPQLDAAARIQWSLSREHDIAIVFKGLPDANGKVYAIGSGVS